MNVCPFTADYKHFTDPTVQCEFPITATRPEGIECCGYHAIEGGNLWIKSEGGEVTNGNQNEEGSGLEASSGSAR